MIDKYLLEELRRETGEKGELARWVIELQKFLDIERRKTVALESKLARVPDREPVLFCMWKGYLDTESVSDSKDVVDAWVEEWNASGENFKTVTLFTTPPAPAIPDGYCLVKKSDVLAVLKPSETSYLGFRIEMTGSMWEAGERMFNAAAPEPGGDAS